MGSHVSGTRIAPNRGPVTVSAKVNENPRQFLNAEVDRLGVPRAEMLRQIIDDWSAVWAGELSPSGV